MLLKKFPVDVINELGRSLEEVPTKGWRRLMRRGFEFYGEEDFVEIQNARILLKDLMGRDKTAEDLIEPLSKIGNTKAVAIIKKGMEEKGFIVPIQDTGGFLSTHDHYDIQSLEVVMSSVDGYEAAMFRLVPV